MMALDEELLHELIGRLYEASLDPGRWPAAIASLSRALAADACRAGPDATVSCGATHARAPQPSGDTTLLAIREQAHCTSADPSMVRFLERLLPHVDKCLEIRVRLENAASAATPLACAMDRLPLAILLLDAPGRVVHGNAAAWRLLRAGDGIALCDGDGRLAAATDAETRRLRRLIAAAGDARGGAMAPGVMLLPRPACGHPCAAHVAPLRPGASPAAAGAAAVLLLIRDPAGMAPLAGTLLIGLFGLTGAEARVATALVAADGLGEVAARLGIGLATVRTHLHRLYEKTGTRRQAELVWLLATLALL